MNEYLGLYMTGVSEHSSHGASVINPLYGSRRTIPSATSRSPIAAIFSIFFVFFPRVWLLSSNSPRGLWISESTTSLLNSFANFSECWTLPRSAYRKAKDTSVCLGHEQVQAVPHIINKSFLIFTRDTRLLAVSLQLVSCSCYSMTGFIWKPGVSYLILFSALTKHRPG